MSSIYIQNFKDLAEQAFLSNLIGNPEDRFSHDGTYFKAILMVKNIG